MFAVDCPVRGHRLLIFPSQVHRISNHDEGIDLVFRCLCGGWGVWRSGARAAGEQLLHHDTPEEPTAPPRVEHPEAEMCARTA